MKTSRYREKRTLCGRPQSDQNPPGRENGPDVPRKRRGRAWPTVTNAPLPEVDLHGRLFPDSGTVRLRVCPRHGNGSERARLPIPLLSKSGKRPNALRQTERLDSHVRLLIRTDRTDRRSARGPLALSQFQSEKRDPRIAVDRDTATAHGTTDSTAAKQAGHPHGEHRGRCASTLTHHLHEDPSLATICRRSRRPRRHRSGRAAARSGVIARTPSRAKMDPCQRPSRHGSNQQTETAVRKPT